MNRIALEVVLFHDGSEAIVDGDGIIIASTISVVSPTIESIAFSHFKKRNGFFNCRFGIAAMCRAKQTLIGGVCLDSQVASSEMS